MSDLLTRIDDFEASYEDIVYNYDASTSVSDCIACLKEAKLLIGRLLNERKKDKAWIEELEMQSKSLKPLYDSDSE